MNSAEKKIIIPEIAIPRPDQLESNVGQEEAKEYAHEFNKIKLDSIKQLIGHKDKFFKRIFGLSVIWKFLIL